ncbi:MAG: hypothetical protein V1787_00720 [Candidatus Micrarchaeota archaeon]
MRQAVILIGLLVAAIAIYAAIPKPELSPYGTDQVKQFVLEDARNDYPSAQVEVLSAGNKDGKWLVDVKIARDAHSKCPKIVMRAYTFPPILFREEVYNDRCSAGGSLLVYPEEAILASAQTSQVKALPEDAQGNARMYTAEEIRALQQCVACSPFEEFSKALPAERLWAVQWDYAGKTLYVALDIYGKAVATS